MAFHGWLNGHHEVPGTVIDDRTPSCRLEPRVVGSAMSNPASSSGRAGQDLSNEREAR